MAMRQERNRQIEDTIEKLELFVSQTSILQNNQDSHKLCRTRIVRNMVDEVKEEHNHWVETKPSQPVSANI